MSRILVTGGAGFIGSHVTDLLLARGHEVLVVDDLSSGRREYVAAPARLERLSIVAPALKQLIRDFHPEGVVHAAAQISVRASTGNPGFDAAVNILGLIHVMESARADGSVRRVVFASSGGAIYGDDAPLPVPESQPPRPLSPYGCAKAAGELYLGYYQAVAGISTVSLRFANVYGPRQDPTGEAGVVAIFARRLLAGEVCRINGTGKQTRDFVYVADVARATVMALDSGVTGALNIGTGVETSIEDLYTRMARLVGSPAAAEHGPALPGEQLRSAIDPGLAGEQLDWAAEVTLDDGLRRSLEWFRRNFGAARRG